MVLGKEKITRRQNLGQSKLVGAMKNGLGEKKGGKKVCSTRVYQPGGIGGPNWWTPTHLPGNVSKGEHMFSKKERGVCWQVKGKKQKKHFTYAQKGGG